MWRGANRESGSVLHATEGGHAADNRPVGAGAGAPVQRGPEDLARLRQQVLAEYPKAAVLATALRVGDRHASKLLDNVRRDLRGLAAARVWDRIEERRAS